MSNLEFKAWPKIPRGLGEKVTITEKIDGTNACIVIDGGAIVGVQSRKRFITPDDDNYGFARWVLDNDEELIGLGDGYHYGEWAGLGIQKNPHNLPEKVFFLFNAGRWTSDTKPKCCSVVPVLYHGELSPDTIDDAMQYLRECSVECKPEGIIVYHHNSRQLYKYTFEHSKGKWNN